MKIIIKRAEKEDKTKILKIEKACFKNPYNKNQINLAFTKYNYYLARVNQRIIGFILASFLQQKNKVAVRRIAVAPFCQRKGAGKLMIAKIGKESKRKNLKIITVIVRRKNKKAINFYQKLGFILTKKLPRYYSPKEDGLKMEQKI